MLPSSTSLAFSTIGITIDEVPTPHSSALGFTSTSGTKSSLDLGFSKVLGSDLSALKVRT
jgi:hypothetical protein